MRKKIKRRCSLFGGKMFVDVINTVFSPWGLLKMKAFIITILISFKKDRGERWWCSERLDT